MKKNSFFISALLIISFLIFNSCEKENSADILLEENVEPNELMFNQTIKIYADNGVDYAKLLISADDSDIITEHLKIYEYFYEVNTKFDFTALKSEGGETINPADYVEELPELWIEVIETSSDPESFTISLKLKKLKVLPPTQYFVGYKTDKNYAKLYLAYIPVASDESGILFKWGYTNSWLGKWHWDENWRWQQGYYNEGYTMLNPASNMGKYKLGLSLYTNTYSNFAYWQSKY